MSDISRGLEWMHKSGFVHPDLATRNCLLDSEGKVMIGDYGLSTSTYKDDYFWSDGKLPIPLRWMPPESLVPNPRNNSLQPLQVSINTFSL